MKRLKTVLLIALTLTIACGEYVMAESERYWAGHQATLSDSELSAQIHIRYSGDGKTYFARHEKGFEGSGKVDANGRLEKQDIHMNWSITGHVTEPLIVYTLNAYDDGDGKEDYSLEDVVLVQLLAARKSPEAAQKAVAEKPNSPSNQLTEEQRAQAKASAEKMRRVLAAALAKAAAEKKHRALAAVRAKAAAEKKRRALAAVRAKAAAEKKRRALATSQAEVAAARAAQRRAQQELATLKAAEEKRRVLAAALAKAAAEKKTDSAIKDSESELLLRKQREKSHKW